MTSRVCIDASLVLKLVLAEDDSDMVHALWTSWLDQNVEMIAPCHLAFEVTSVIRNHVYRGNISADAGETAFDAVQAQEIFLIHPSGLEERAWELSRELARPTAYDAYYLALAEMAGCELWTADKRLYQVAKDRLPWVRWLGERASATQLDDEL